MKTASQKRFRFDIAGGGTGGHLFPAMAIAHEIKRRLPEAEITFWGTKRGIEAKILPTTDYSLEFIPVRGFQRRLSFGNVLFPFDLSASLMKVFRVLLSKRPKAVIGTGGYVSGPVAFVAWLLWIPVFIQEQNSYPGATTRLLARIARRVYIAFEVSKEYFANRDKLQVTGNPVRADIHRADRNEAFRRFGFSPDQPVLFVFGGSQGARRINQLLAAILPDLLEETPVQILWATGPHDFEEIREKVGTNDRVKLFDFIQDMPSAYAVSSLVISRAGATTLAELAACGLPSVLIPYPFATGGHQVFNARSFESEGAAVCLLEKDLTPESLKRTLQELLRDPEKLKRMGRSAQKLAKADAAKRIVDDIFTELKIE
ncbi:MAG: undecaprenyldiphospho-muramoylpentapeptide beta-N-acetylglucosaminyltransferase [Calditrichaeota bacterium]|nr:undecaprenyldiphospho-muramoylpentapeptide beta-N-acetylglucosaminyltransferase [Calditrichota bacterium]